MATPALRYEPRVRIRCCDCGVPVLLTERQSRRIDQNHRCAVCAAIHRHRDEPVTDRFRRYWLKRFSDEELAKLASDILGEEITAEQVRACWDRTRLGV